jgi:hypothetical protein
MQVAYRMTFTAVPAMPRGSRSRAIIAITFSANIMTQGTCRLDLFDYFTVS